MLFLLLLFCTPCNASKKTISLEEETADHIIQLTEIEKKINNILGQRKDADFLTASMINASAKFPSGLSNGVLFHLGNFDQCYKIKSQNIFGKYCLGTFPIDAEYFKKHFKRNITTQYIIYHPQLGQIGTGVPYLAKLYFGVCVPSSLKAEDIPGLLTYSEGSCYSKAAEPKLLTGSLIALLLLGLYGILVLAATVYDFNSHKSPNFGESRFQLLLIAFSLISNCRKIFASSKSREISCLDGFRAVTMMLIVLGHQIVTATFGPISNFFDYLTIKESTLSTFAEGNIIVVEVFFVFGGILNVYTFLKFRRMKCSVFTVYMYRYLWLTPTLLVVITFHLFFLNYFGNGPLWKTVDILLVEPCQHSWWKTVLYISNYKMTNNYICVPQTWYSPVDMQLFVLSPFVLMILNRSPRQGLFLLAILTGIGILIPFVLVYTENLNWYTDLEKHFQYYYVKTHTRFAPYTIGMICGYFVYKIRTGNIKVKLSKREVFLAWLCCLTGLLTSLYIGCDLNVTENRWKNAFILAFNRPIWSTFFSIVILLCVAGYGGPIDSFFSLSIFRFLSKFSYSVYLVHFSVQVIRYASMKETFRFTKFQISIHFLYDFLLTLILSIILHLFIQSPVEVLCEYYFKNKKKAQ